jgi:hypothetical protein
MVGFYCGDFFDPSPRHKNQSACKKVKCQRAKKAAWQRHKISDHQQSWGYEDGPWKGPGPPLLVAADF